MADQTRIIHVHDMILHLTHIWYQWIIILQGICVWLLYKHKFTTGRKLDAKIRKCKHFFFSFNSPTKPHLIVNINWKTRTSITFAATAVAISSRAASSVLYFLGMWTLKYFNIPSKSNASKSFLDICKSMYYISCTVIILPIKTLVPLF